jgi:hypothetical protein
MTFRIQMEQVFDRKLTTEDELQQASFVFYASLEIDGSTQ